ncbi:hypothetical protein [Pseudoduganella umbonata]|uniref:Glycosyltransferase n=1 Tax=Pseudoduganella umbonata TaxID=864828 RepID=A0A4P8HU72_9BURK|nr:hypothetical protein [Pseudoduganella umbonata]MBB3225276.1 hypothetical protein [Pseudoduganella umbonata]QCP12288.1 hypothetical protein FCL38_19085 [Pseudoduganella umbonata]
MADLDIKERVLRRTTPVIINSYNQPTYLKNIVSKLREEDFSNIYVLDQASTNPELVNYLAALQQSGDAMPLLSAANKGPHEFFLSRLYDLFGGAPLIYTDPDLTWDRLAPNFLTRHFDIAHRYRIFKVGSALTIPAPHEAKPDLITKVDPSGPMSVAQFESRYWTTPIEADVYNAPIDTTMHLFIPAYYEAGKPLITGARLGGPGFELKHLPWFLSDPMPAEEYAFYLGSSTHTTWRSDQGQEPA